MDPGEAEKNGPSANEDSGPFGHSRNPILRFIHRESNFFRIHLFYFTIVPLITSGIFYGANGEYPVPYIDALFLTYSSMTVTGLSTINLSTTTPFQQSILFVLMLFGDVTMVALAVVLVRKWYFRVRCEAVVRGQPPGLGRTFTQYFSQPHMAENPTNTATATSSKPSFRRRMSLRVSNPFGARPLHQATDAAGATSITSPRSNRSVPLPTITEVGITGPTPRPTLDDRVNHLSSSGPGDEWAPRDALMLTSSPQHIETELPPETPASPGVTYANQPTNSGPRLRSQASRMPTRTRTREPTAFMNREDQPTRAKHKDLGGLPGPITLATKVFHRFAPQKLRLGLRRTFTAPPPATLVPTTALEQDFSGPVQYAKYFTTVVVGVARNSKFHIDDLSDDQLEEMGGVEYRALRVLGYLVAAYFIFTQFFSFLLIGPYMSSRYEEVFAAQPRLVSRWWFALFQVVAGYTGGGLSLVDEGMAPFQRTYIMIISLMFIILAGNHALPIFLRLIIWLWTKVVKDDGELDKTLHFLLDHPRRCFFYLFPSHQTWYLVIVLVAFSCVEFAAFMVLNIGLSVTESLPVGTRIIDGLFQGLAARASGFSIVSISALAPGVQFLYVVMMYIAVYPVAMSIRSTNVYEETSLGVYGDAPPDEDEEPDLSKAQSRGERISKYLKWHVHRQIANDIWWLVCGIFLVATIERAKIADPETPWFDLFRICFELVSAFAGIGLSLGTPNNNFSFSGACGPLSKLVIIVIMLRGRHRGLPVAVDRSIMLPKEFKDLQTGEKKTPETNARMPRLSTRASTRPQEV